MTTGTANIAPVIFFGSNVWMIRVTASMLANSVPCVPPSRQSIFPSLTPFRIATGILYVLIEVEPTSMKLVIFSPGFAIMWSILIFDKFISTIRFLFDFKKVRALQYTRVFWIKEISSFN